MSNKDKYTTGDLADIVGITRDTLRHYESKGLIQPKQNEENNYREFGFYDIYALMFIDFYKKRGLTLEEIKRLQTGSQLETIRELLQKRGEEIQEMISLQSRLLHNIQSTLSFCETLEQNLNQCSIKKMPLLEVQTEFSDFSSFGEYHRILSKINKTKDDILSNLIRQVDCSDDVILGTKMLVAKEVSRSKKTASKGYLDYPNCIYTVVEDGRAGNSTEDITLTTFNSIRKWAKTQNLSLHGCAFITTRLITYQNNTEQVFLEVFTPIK